MLFRFLLLTALISLSANAAEQSFRIPITVISSTRSFDGNKESEKREIIGSPIIIVENGSTRVAEAATLMFSILPSLESENLVRMVVMVRGPKTYGPFQITIKLGEKGTVHIPTPDTIEYYIEMTPSLVNVGFNIKFPGGTLEQLVTQLTDNGKSPFNLVGDKAYLSVAIRAFTVRNASPVDFAQALSFLLAAQDVTISATGNDEHFQPIFFIKSKKNEHPATEFTCYNLIPWLEKGSTGAPSSGSKRTKVYTADEIVKILTDAYEFQRGGPSTDDLRFRFNPETKLLFITGRPELVHSAGVTLEALPKPERLY